MPTSTQRAGTPRTGQTLTARSRRTRVALVAGVRAELRASGGFTAETVAERAGCSAATFYSHFGNKDDALAAGFAQTLDDLVDGLTDRLTGDALVADLAGTVERFVDWQADFFRVESLVFRTAISRLPDHRPLRATFRDAERRAVAHLTEALATAQRHGVVRPDTAADDLAEAFLVAGQGINNPRALRPAAAAVRAALARSISAMLVPTST
ncbi:MAG: TetR/AcrR family transcriptional regulator [Actinomycetota bacterium]